MDFKSHLENAWHLCLRNIAPLILMTLVMTLLSIFTFGLLAPVLFAGYVYTLLRLIREGREPKIQELFSHLRLFFPLLVLSLLIFLAVFVGFKLFFLPGIAVVCVVTFGWIYVLPLMVDKNMGVIEAIKTSWQMAIQGNIADHIVVVILFIGLISIGSSVFIGTLFTQPFATILVLLAYLERIGGNITASSVKPESPLDKKY